MRYPCHEPCRDNDGCACRAAGYQATWDWGGDAQALMADFEARMTRLHEQYHRSLLPFDEVFTAYMVDRDLGDEAPHRIGRWERGQVVIDFFAPPATEEDHRIARELLRLRRPSARLGAWRLS